MARFTLVPSPTARAGYRITIGGCARFCRLIHFDILTNTIMRQDIHPKTQKVAFQDIPTGNVFIALSTLTSKETIDWEGTTYPLVRLEVSSASHPFYTGTQNMGTAQGRVEKFREKYGMA